MRLPLLYALLAIALLVPGLPHSPLGVVRAWLGIVSAALCLLYVIALWPERRVGPWIRSRGPVSGAARALIAPHSWGAWTFLLLKIRLHEERHLDEIVPGLYLGRRPLAGDRERNQPLALTSIVDLCVEFPPSAPVLGVAETDYLALPALDGTAPAVADVQHAVDWIEGKLAAGQRVLVHCAAGHGRSATVVAALLIARGLASDADTAERLMRASRPLVSLNRSQRRLIERLPLRS